MIYSVSKPGKRKKAVRGVALLSSEALADVIIGFVQYSINKIILKLYNLSLVVIYPTIASAIYFVYY